MEIVSDECQCDVLRYIFRVSLGMYMKRGKKLENFVWV
jgi:hypothetical protein